jgi:hypothetical protein
MRDAGAARIASADAPAFISGSLRRHTDRTPILRQIWRQRFFLVGYFLEVLASIRSAMERRIGPQGRTIIDHHSIRYPLSNDDNRHAADQASVIVKKINVRPSETLRDKNCALVGPQDYIDNFWIGYGDLSERTLAMNRRRESLGQLHRLSRWALDREWSELIREAIRREKKKKTRKKDCRID